jgi:hypothetical protein
LYGNRAVPPRPSESRGEVARLRSASVFGRDSAARVMFRHVPTRGEAKSDGETALLRLVKALVQRLLGVGQAPQRYGPSTQRIRTSAQALGCIDRLAGSASRLAPREPLLADVTERLLDRGPVLLLVGRQLQRGLEGRDARIGNAAMSSAAS